MEPEDFLKAGYRKFQCVDYDRKNKVLYQKRIEQKYFINAWYYDFSEFTPVMKNSLYRWDFEAQMYEPKTFNVTLINEPNFTVDDIETFFENVYLKLSCLPDPYKRQLMSKERRSKRIELKKKLDGYVLQHGTRYNPNLVWWRPKKASPYRRWCTCEWCAPKAKQREAYRLSNQNKARNAVVYLFELDGRVDSWNKGDSELELHNYLGLTWEEYACFVENPTKFACDQLDKLPPKE